MGTVSCFSRLHHASGTNKTSNDCISIQLVLISAHTKHVVLVIPKSNSLSAFSASAKSLLIVASMQKDRLDVKFHCRTVRRSPTEGS